MTLQDIQNILMVSEYLHSLESNFNGTNAIVLFYA